MFAGKTDGRKAERQKGKKAGKEGRWEGRQADTQEEGRSFTHMHMYICTYI
jgi:hypothetical protein